MSAWKRIVTAGLLAWLAAGMMATQPARAQDDESGGLTDISIAYDDTVQDTITEDYFFDRFTFSANTGDIVFITMRAYDGLAPLIGIFNTTGDLLFSSDGRPENDPVDAAPNDSITLQARMPSSGDFVIVATRAGNLDGTTTGSYELTLRLANNTALTPDVYQDVTFRCDAALVTTAATIEFAGSAGEAYRVSVYGLGGFVPVIRTEVNLLPETTTCTAAGVDMTGDVLMVPGLDPLIVDAETAVARLDITSGELLDLVQVTIGSVDGGAGRYIVVIEGLNIETGSDTDSMDIRLGPLAYPGAMDVYMIGIGNTRLNPSLAWLVDLDDVDQDVLCEDAGRRECEGVPPLDTLAIDLTDGLSVQGDRFDAGLLLSSDSVDALEVDFRSSAASATGPYVIVLVGELSAQDEGE